VVSEICVPVHVSSFSQWFPFPTHPHSSPHLHFYYQWIVVAIETAGAPLLDAARCLIALNFSKYFPKASVSRLHCVPSRTRQWSQICQRHVDFRTTSHAIFRWSVLTADFPHQFNYPWFQHKFKFQQPHKSIPRSTECLHFVKPRISHPHKKKQVGASLHPNSEFELPTNEGTHHPHTMKGLWYIARSPIHDHNIMALR